MRKPGNKIMRIRGWALAMVFIGMAVMYLGISRTPWAMLIFLILEQFLS